MSLPVPLAVRIQTNLADTHITKHVRDLWYRSVAPGGFAACTVSLHRPIDVRQLDIAHYARLYVYDTRNAACVWEGRVEDLGRSAGDDGMVWEIGAVGPMAHTKDRTIPLIYVDTAIDSESWIRVDDATPGATFRVGNDPGAGTGSADTQALVFQFPQGLGITTNSRVVARYRKLQETGQKLARYDYIDDEGRTSTDLAIQCVTRTDGSLASGENSRTATFSTAGHGSSAKLITTDWTSGRTTLELRVLWSGGAVTVGDDVTWAAVRNVVIQATRYNSSGSELTAAADYPSNTITADLVVNDLIGRLLTLFKATSVATGGHNIDQLAYPNGVTAAKVLDDLMALNSDHRWLVFDQVDSLGNPTLRSTTSGKYGVEWAAEPTDVGYQASARDGLDLPGTSADLYNAVTVRWRDESGQVRRTRSTQAVPELDNMLLTREAFIDLGDEIASSSAATRAGEQFLAAHARPMAAGRLTVGGPITYYRSKSWGAVRLDPWQVRPFETVRITGLSDGDTLEGQPTVPDGQTSFFVVGTEYRASTNTVELELDRHPASTAQGISAAVRGKDLLRRWTSPLTR
jgi:hypothetical protein